MEKNMFARMNEGRLILEHVIEYEDEDNELITTYILDEENTDKIKKIIPFDENDPGKMLFQTIRSILDFEETCIMNGIRFTWSEQWDYPVRMPKTKHGTEKDCFTARHMNGQ
ncbi:MAG: hypothetical protein IJM50_07135 [Lachnospiraceae bacterium]|nr:hypothetical protein [Lachnospiraceae bacterium]